ncbi:transcriptional regulator [Desmophyllum pertusum]|uniref:Transcriptional regulator n=1 Tax=Desmophyllum pertusum TaxID=174260 RepID=A0A9W9ZN46_9CNID|nr:transcriptional regulator [Desmophyllum pertusum]
MEVLSPPDGAENKEDGATLETSQEGQQATEVKKKRKVSKKKDDSKDEGEKLVYSFVDKRPTKKEKKEASKEKKQEIKESIVQEEPPSPQNEEDSKEDGAKPKGSYALADMEKATFDACKEKMRPVKRALKMLESPEDNTNEKDQVTQTKQCLLKIGDHIMEITSHYKDADVVTDWRNNLWTFVSKFTSFEAKKLFKLYKHAAKKRDELKSQERAQHKPGPHSQRSSQTLQEGPSPRSTQEIMRLSGHPTISKDQRMEAAR